jgi:hypothetical protein
MGDLYNERCFFISYFKLFALIFILSRKVSTILLVSFILSGLKPRKVHLYGSHTIRGLEFGALTHFQIRVSTYLGLAQGWPSPCHT